ncbi:unnamed protein product [Amoebophrya sp. A120]|nr:unnamed protein product [Amoebophrya sp. A120]|eukprot:GSA120T00018237001.1
MRTPVRRGWICNDRAPFASQVCIKISSATFEMNVTVERFILSDQVLEPDSDPDPVDDAEDRQCRFEDRKQHFYFSNYVRCPKLVFGTGTKWIQGRYARNGGGASTIDATGTKHGQEDFIDEELVSSVIAALDAGIRHIDTAEFYGQEQSVGEAIQRWTQKTGIDRREIFLTTKYWPGLEGKKSVASKSTNATAASSSRSGGPSRSKSTTKKKKAADGTPGAEAQAAAEVVSGTAGAPAAPLPESASSSGQEEQDIEADILGSLCESLDRLQTDYVDLYLLHCPFEAFNVDKSLQEDAKRLADNLIFPEDDNLNLHGTNKATAATAELHQQAGSLELFRSRMRHANQKRESKLRRAWARMEQCAKRGLCRSIGLSNFPMSDIECLMFEEKTNTQAPKPGTTPLDNKLRCAIAPVCNQVEAHLHLDIQDLENFRKPQFLVNTRTDKHFHQWFGLRDDRSLIPKTFVYGAAWPLRATPPGEFDVDPRKLKERWPESEPEEKRQKEVVFGAESSVESEQFEIDTDPEKDPFVDRDYEPPYDDEDCWEKNSEDSEDTRDRKKRKRQRLRLKDIHDLERNPPIDTPWEKNRDLKRCLYDLATARNTSSEVVAYKWCLDQDWGLVFTSANADRIKHIATDIYNIELTAPDREKLKKLGTRWDDQRQHFVTDFQHYLHCHQLMTRT